MRAVIGWAMGPRLTGELAQQTLTMALRHRNPKVGLTHHSDRNSQYATRHYQRLLCEHGITANMSRTGNCWDDACVESFSGTLKRELVYHRQYHTREEATQDIFECIEVFYNRLRRHSTLGSYSFPGRVRGEDGCGVTKCPRSWGKVSFRPRTARRHQGVARPSSVRLPS